MTDVEREINLFFYNKDSTICDLYGSKMFQTTPPFIFIFRIFVLIGFERKIKEFF